MPAGVSRRVLAAIASTLLLVSASAQAGIFRAYLSLDGNDTNPCTLPLPCRLLPAALAAIDDGGEIWMLDSANYNTGPVAITKSVTILAVPGVLGSVVASAGNAINISTANVRVTLRNLNILPLPGFANARGILMTNGANLTVQNCNIFNFTSGMGLQVITPSQVTIIDSVFRSNSYGAEFEGARARISGSHFTGGSVGVHAVANTTGVTSIVTLSKSVVSNISSAGIAAETFSANAASRVYVTDTVIESSNYGVLAYVSASLANAAAEATVSNSLVVLNNNSALRAEGFGAKMIASGNTVSNNFNGFYQASSGVFESAGNNTVRNNINATIGTITGVGTM